MKKLVSLLAMFMVMAGMPLAAFADEHGEPPVEELEREFENLIYNQETTEDGWQLADYESYQALTEDFERIMSPDTAAYYLETFFNEEDGNAYLEPTEGPPLIQFDEEYELEQVSDTEYQLTQSSGNELYGDYTLQITYSYEGGNWIITERTENYDSVENGGELPNTATSAPMMILFGSVLIGAGALLMAGRRVYNK